MSWSWLYIYTSWKAKHIFPQNHPTISKVKNINFAWNFNHGVFLMIKNVTLHGLNNQSKPKTWWRHQIKWKYFPQYFPLLWGSTCFPYKGQWRGTLMHSLICDWTSDWVNNWEADYLRRHHAHYSGGGGGGGWAGGEGGGEGRVEREKGGGLSWKIGGGGGGQMVGGRGNSLNFGRGCNRKMN